MKKRVLLVDDEPRVRASLRTVLEPTYEILEAADAAEGLRSFKHDAPDLVLLDVILPGADGLSALQTMRTENRAVPVIMLTGTKAVKTAVDAMKLGAADYLAKRDGYLDQLPFTLERAISHHRLDLANQRADLLGMQKQFSGTNRTRCRFSTAHWYDSGDEYYFGGKEGCATCSLVSSYRASNSLDRSRQPSRRANGKGRDQRR